MTFYLTPVFGVAGGVTLLGNQVTWVQIIRIVVVFAGVYLVNREKFCKDML